ncbi:MAG: GTPase HflX [Ignavibacteriota bacterium]|nr:GTPase HflX [Ignavibacteriota bacterium]MCZ7616085.1 GTPase HflX [Ignavibacteriaceae bacterium]QKJ95259.1 MAG: GTPase HflX [Ignavibacteriota bacterium]GIK59666.1 MAG: GTPase HflX [Ignavibacteriota bacterium]GJQ40595.1 MAG: GTPase HflX [Ignavibacteriaceae bacterium]
MIEINRKKVERAMLVALQTRNVNRELTEEHLSELEELADTAGAESIFKIIQSKNSIDSAFYIGKGKAEELAQLIELNGIDLAIFDDDLTPVQVRNLEKLFNRKIIDRSGLILDIFALRAKTKEAKTQVELAQLEYMLPRLTRAWTHLSKQYGGIGTKGPGETQIETDRRMIRTRISHLKEKLKSIESQRETQSKGRKDFVRISIAGYTNAGKSTLFNLLTKSDVFAEDKLFATLDSTTRTVNFDTKEKILISDTVGFIRKLPAHLVASFKSTLNEVRDSDIILHLIDLSHPYYEDHLKVVDETLKEFDSEHKKEIKVFNKVDSVDDKSIIEYVRNKFPDGVVISAKKGINISALIKSIENVIKDSFVEQELTLGIEQTKLASQIHDLAEVTSVKYNHDTVLFKFRANKENSDKIKKLLENYK